MQKTVCTKNNLTRNWKAIVQLLSDDYVIPMSELPQQIPAEIQDLMPPTPKQVRSDCNKCDDAREKLYKMSNKYIKYYKQLKGIPSLKDYTRKLTQALKHKAVIEIKLRTELHKQKIY